MTKTNKYLILLAFLALANPLWQVNPYYGHRQVIVTLCCLALFWFISKYDWRKWILIVTVLAGVFVSIETYAQWLGDSLIFPAGVGVITSTIGNSNYVAAYLLFPIFACLALRKTWLLALLFLIPALIISRGRAGWIGFAVGMGLYAWLTLPKHRVRLAIWGAVSILIATWGVITYKPDVLNSDTLRCRVKYWQAGWEIIRENPVLGIGFDGYRSEVYEAQARIIKRDPGWMKKWYDKKPRRVHNMYLEALADGGIVWAIALFAFIGRILYRSYHRAREDLSVLAVWCGLVAVLVNSIFFFTAKILVTWVMLWVFLGILDRGEK